MSARADGGTHARRVDLLAVYSFFFSAVFIIQPIVLFKTEATKHYSILRTLPTLIPIALLYASIFFCFFLVGYHVKMRWKYLQLQKPKRHLNHAGLIAVLGIMATACVLIAQNASSIASMIVASRMGDTQHSLPIIKAIVQALNVYMILLVFALSGRDRRLALVGVFLTSVTAISIGDRSMLVLPVIVAVYTFYRNGRIGNLSLAFGVASSLLLIIFLGVVREYLLYGYLELPSVGRSLSKGLNLITFDQFLLYLNYSDGEPIRGGSDFINGLFGMVPRSVWPDKPEFITPGAWLGYAVYGRSDLGFPFTVVGEWYANFGATGLIIGGFLSGVAVRFAENLIRAGRGIEGSVLYFYCLVGGLPSVFIVKVVFALLVPLSLLKLTLRKGALLPSRSQQSSTSTGAI